MHEREEPPAISEAESAVMQALWLRAPQAADELCATLQTQRDWTDATVKTLINRLLKKGAISAEPDGRRYLYAPLLQRDAWLGAQSTGLLDRLFGGRVAPLVAHFSAQRSMSADDLAELKQLLSKLEQQNEQTLRHRAEKASKMGEQA
jgi:BlaI family transcriptional regulator, penicillinase repressor